MKKIITIFTIIVLCGIQNSYGQLSNGEKSFLHTQTANSYSPGQFGIYSNMNFYSKIGDFIGQAAPTDFESVNYWLVASNFVFTYGFTEHFDASLGVRLYQDTHYENEFNLPDDIFLTLRGASFSFARNHVKQGFLASFRIPTGEIHNYPFTEYTTNSVQYGIMYLVSYYADAYLPNRSASVHFNAGWWNYNEHGTLLYERANGTKLNATKNSSDFRMALSFSYPTALFDFRTELTGILFINEPDAFVYSAEEWAFITPSVRIKPTEWFNFDLGIDFRISPGDRNATSGIPDPSTNLDLPPNYPDWRVHMGANFNFNLLGSDATSDLSYEQERAREKIEMFEAVVKEREKAESVQNEIDNLKQVSQEAEKEIEELKKILDDN